MRALNVVNWLAPGGIELLLLRAAPRLKKLGVHVDICCTGPRHLLDDQFESHGCRIYRIPKSANCYDTAARIERLTRDAYDLVHSHFGYTSGGIACGASRASTPVLISVHNSRPLALSGWRNRPLLGPIRDAWLAWHGRLMERHAEAFLCHSIANQIGFARRLRDASRCRVVPLGVDCPPTPEPSQQEARRALGLDGQGPLLLHVGSLSHKKNHAGLFEIFRRLLRIEPDAKLLLVGDGPLRDELAVRANELGICDRVCFVGPKKDVWPWYAAADVFVFPSHVEGFGVALAEAQMTGLPIVASDIPPHRESVSPDQRRFLFTPGDYADAAELVCGQLEASRRGDNSWVEQSRDYVHREFSIERYVEDIASVYREFAPQAA